MTHIAAQQVRQLRERTGARVMDCKQALVASTGDEERAISWLRDRDLMRAGGLTDNELNAGFVEMYLHHDKRVGVLLEVNCQTDFVARSQPVQTLAKELAMQIAAFPVGYLRLEEIPSQVVENYRASEQSQPDLAQKPESQREKIVEGRVAKRLKSITLLELPTLHDAKITVRETIARVSAAVGERIEVKRFARFALGE